MASCTMQELEAHVTAVNMHAPAVAVRLPKYPTCPPQQNAAFTQVFNKDPCSPSNSSWSNEQETSAVRTWQRTGWRGCAVFPQQVGQCSAQSRTLIVVVSGVCLSHTAAGQYVVSWRPAFGCTKSRGRCVTIGKWQNYNDLTIVFTVKAIYLT